MASEYLRTVHLFEELEVFAAGAGETVRAVAQGRELTAFLALSPVEFVVGDRKGDLTHFTKAGEVLTIHVADLPIYKLVHIDEFIVVLSQSISLEAAYADIQAGCFQPGLLHFVEISNKKAKMRLRPLPLSIEPLLFCFSFAVSLDTRVCALCGVTQQQLEMNMSIFANADADTAAKMLPIPTGTIFVLSGNIPSAKIKAYAYAHMNRGVVTDCVLADASYGGYTSSSLARGGKLEKLNNGGRSEHHLFFCTGPAYSPFDAELASPYYAGELGVVAINSAVFASGLMSVFKERDKDKDLVRNTALEGVPGKQLPRPLSLVAAGGLPGCLALADVVATNSSSSSVLYKSTAVMGAADFLYTYTVQSTASAGGSGAAGDGQGTLAMVKGGTFSHPGLKYNVQAHDAFSAFNVERSPPGVSTLTGLPLLSEAVRLQLGAGNGAAEGSGKQQALPGMSAATLVPGSVGKVILASGTATEVPLAHVGKDVRVLASHLLPPLFTLLAVSDTAGTRYTLSFYKHTPPTSTDIANSLFQSNNFAGALEYFNISMGRAGGADDEGKQRKSMKEMGGITPGTISRSTVLRMYLERGMEAVLGLSSGDVEEELRDLNASNDCQEPTEETLAALSALGISFEKKTRARDITDLPLDVDLSPVESEYAPDVPDVPGVSGATEEGVGLTALADTRRRTTSPLLMGISPTLDMLHDDAFNRYSPSVLRYLALLFANTPLELLVQRKTHDSIGALRSLMGTYERQDGAPADPTRLDDVMFAATGVSGGRLNTVGGSKLTSTGTILMDMWEEVLEFLIATGGTTRGDEGDEEDAEVMLTSIPDFLANLHALGVNPLAVLRVLANARCRLEVVRKYVNSVFGKLEKDIGEADRKVTDLSHEIGALEATCRRLAGHQTGAGARGGRQGREEAQGIPFECLSCDACREALDLPSVHFLCGHSVHLRCVAKGVVAGRSQCGTPAGLRGVRVQDQHMCPVCRPENDKLLEEHKVRTAAIKRGESARIASFEDLAEQVGRRLYDDLKFEER